MFRDSGEVIFYLWAFSALSAPEEWYAVSDSVTPRLHSPPQTLSWLTLCRLQKEIQVETGYSNFEE